MQNPQSHIDQHVLAEYALDTLTVEEIVPISSHLQSCSRCQQEMASLRATAGLLPYGLTGIEPPVNLRDRIVDAAASGWSAPAPRNPVRQRQTGPGWFRRFAPGLVALTFAVGLLLGRALPGSNSGLQLPQGETVTLAGQGRGTVLVANNRSYIRVTLEGLPPLDAGKVYQLWFLGRAAPISGGTFAATPDGKGQIELRGLAWSPEYTGIAITIEPVGGNPGPTSDIVANANL